MVETLRADNAWQATPSPDEIRADFSLLAQEHAPLYLDNAATTQKPQCVLDAVELYYRQANANPYRGVYALSGWATEMYEGARKGIAAFIGAASPKEVVFTSGCTEALNLVAWCYGMNHLKAGDKVVVPISEHHSNLLPWQEVCRRTGAELDFLYLDEGGRIPAAEIERRIDDTVKIVACAHLSNVTGLFAPVERLVQAAHAHGAVVVLDCAQSAAHVPLDMQALGVDFAAFSGHKVYGPMGIGVLWGRRELLDQMPPLYRGGGMVDVAERETATFAATPRKFEAGTRNVGGAVGMAQALGYLRQIGYEAIAANEREAVAHLLRRLSAIPAAKVYGPARMTDDRCGIVSFNIASVHSDDIARVLASHGACIRVGNHCAQPLMRFLGVTSVCRASVACTTSVAEVERFCDLLEESVDEFSRYIVNAVM